MEPSPTENLSVKAAERPRPDPRDHNALEVVGAYLLAHGQMEKALECFHRITREDPAYPGIWRLRAKASEALGDCRNAEVCRRRGADPLS